MFHQSLLASAVLVAAVAAQGDPVASKVARPPVVQPDVKVTPAQPPKVQAPATPGAPAPVARPGRATATEKTAGDALAHSIAQALASRDTVLFDQPTADSALWFVGSNYKAAFDADGWQFVAQPATPADEALPVHFRTTGWSLAGTSKAVGPVAPTRVGNRVEYHHGAFVEAIDVRGGNVEQTFRFDTLATRGELTMTLAVTTGRTGVDRGDGITFDSPVGDVSYSEAIAVDATGARTVAETVLADGHITIRVPAAFVAEARLPLVIDPLVASNVAYNGNTANVSNPDLVWDEGSQTWSVAFERLFSANDIDVYVQRLDANLTPLGTVSVIDSSFDVWQLPKIANLRLYGKNLVVAQVSVDAPAPYWIAGRIVDGAGALTTGQFDIERASVAGHAFGDKLRPDVGGDPLLAGPTYFTVVWERVISSADHDVHMKQVTEAGALRSVAPTLIDNSTFFESRPSISKSDGPALASDQRFVVCYQRTFSPTDEDIRAALLTWDGQFVQVGGNDNYSVDSSVENDTLPQVSTPSDGGSNGVRHVMFVYQRTTSGSNDIAGSVGSIDGTMLAFANLTSLENDPGRLAWPQYSPGVDCDGTRFGVVFQELFGGSGSDQDTRISLFGFDTNTGTIVAQEPAVTLGFSGDPEFNPQVASRYASSGARSTRYATVNERSVMSPFVIEAHSYDGFAPGGISTRATQCGSLGISVTGSPVLGMSLDFSIGTGFPLAGFAFGAPANVPIPTCACILGVNGTLVIANPLHIAIPQRVNLVGLPFSAQGFTFQAGPCLGSVSVSDTIDFTIQ